MQITANVRLNRFISGENCIRNVIVGSLGDIRVERVAGRVTANFLLQEGVRRLSDRTQARQFQL
jgi:hypothetical protein